MSQGKYSPNLPNSGPFIYNCHGQIPPQFFSKEEYDEKVHFANYDSSGYDMYGYSCFDSNGNYVGTGRGVDRNGKTELEYMSMSEDEFLDYC